jgi:16S rRNA (guanine1207-N2)-methyltransferase
MAGLRDPAALARAALEPGELLEINDWQAVRAQGGVACLSWRAQARAARAAGCAVAANSDPDDGRRFAQVLVHHGRGRAGTLADLHLGWTRLAPAGRLLFAGSNEDGIRSTARAWAAQQGLEWQTLHAAGHGRVLAVTSDRRVSVGFEPAEWQVQGLHLRASPGTFCAGRLDAGSELLLDCLTAWTETTPRHIADLCCGNGILALAALRRWPAANAWLGDADARAVADARHNVAAASVVERCTVAWWDADDGLSPPPGGWDLILSNPPWHTGHAVDRGPAQRLLADARAACAPGGRVLVVATRTQPFEALLPGCRCVAERGGFKILAWTVG